MARTRMMVAGLAGAVALMAASGLARAGYCRCQMRPIMVGDSFVNLEFGGNCDSADPDDGSVHVSIRRDGEVILGPALKPNFFVHDLKEEKLTPHADYAYTAKVTFGDDEPGICEFAGEEVLWIRTGVLEGELRYSAVIRAEEVDLKRVKVSPDELLVFLPTTTITVDAGTVMPGFLVEGELHIEGARLLGSGDLHIDARYDTAKVSVIDTSIELQEDGFARVEVLGGLEFHGNVGARALVEVHAAKGVDVYDNDLRDGEVHVYDLLDGDAVFTHNKLRLIEISDTQGGVSPFQLTNNVTIVENVIEDGAVPGGIAIRSLGGDLEISGNTGFFDIELHWFSPYVDNPYLPYVGGLKPQRVIAANEDIRHVRMGSIGHPEDSISGVLWLGNRFYDSWSGCTFDLVQGFNNWLAYNEFDNDRKNDDDTGPGREWTGAICLGYADTLSASVTDNTILGNSIVRHYDGIRLGDATGNVIESNYLHAVSSNIVLGGHHPLAGPAQDSEASDNLVFDNRFVSDGVWVESVDRLPPCTTAGRCVNDWNVEREAGHNIVGGPFRGGNYWPEYVGPDDDGDELGDIPHDLDEDNADALPLVADLLDEPTLDIVSTSPAPNELDVAHHANLWLEFDRPIACGTLNPGTAVVMPTYAWMAGVRFTVDCHADGVRVRFEPHEPFLSSTEVTVMIGGGPEGVRGRDGSYMQEDHAFTFTVSDDVPEPDPEPIFLQVLTVDPAAGAEDAPADTEVVVAFDLDVRCEGVSSETFQLTAGGAPIEGELSCLRHEVTFTPDANIALGATVRGWIAGGPNGVRSLSDRTLKDDYEWTFQVATEPPAGDGDGPDSEADAGGGCAAGSGRSAGAMAPGWCLVLIPFLLAAAGYRRARR